MNNIRYLRVIVTNKCNLNCFFCHREGIKSHEQKLNLEQLLACIEILTSIGIMKVKFIGGEPTICAGLDYLVREIKKKNDKIDVSLITNGITSKKIVDKLINSRIDRINVSLHGFDLETFRKITGGTEKQLNSVFEMIRYLSSKKILGKINYVLLKGINEEEFLQVIEYVHQNDYVLDILNYLDDDPKKFEQYHYDFSEIEAMIRKLYAVSEIGAYENKYSIPSARMSLVGGGVINMKVNQLKNIHFLKGCDCCAKKDSCDEGIAAIRLTSDGVIKPCIFRDDNCFDLIDYMREHTINQTVLEVKNYLETL